MTNMKHKFRKECVFSHFAFKVSLAGWCLLSPAASQLAFRDPPHVSKHRAVWERLKLDPLRHERRKQRNREESWYSSVGGNVRQIPSKHRAVWERLKRDPLRHERRKQRNREEARRYRERLMTERAACLSEAKNPQPY
ncbi:hypothetical protein ACOMHN_022965 [Nucella lapillus]